MHPPPKICVESESLENTPFSFRHLAAAMIHYLSRLRLEAERTPERDGAIKRALSAASTVPRSTTSPLLCFVRTPTRVHSHYWASVRCVLEKYSGCELVILLREYGFFYKCVILLFYCRLLLGWLFAFVLWWSCVLGGLNCLLFKFGFEYYRKCFY